MAVRVCLFALCGLCSLNEAEQKNRGAEKTVDMREAQRLKHFSHRLAISGGFLFSTRA